MSKNSLLLFSLSLSSLLYYCLGIYVQNQSSPSCLFAKASYQNYFWNNLNSHSEPIFKELELLKDLNNRWKLMKIDDRKINRWQSINYCWLASIGIRQSTINRWSHLGGRELHRLPSIGTKFMSPYLQVSRECTQIVYYFWTSVAKWENCSSMWLREKQHK